MAELKINITVDDHRAEQKLKNIERAGRRDRIVHLRSVKMGG
jgi:hypothetical protein